MEKAFPNTNEVNKSCPEFPFFGAGYPDARCIDGELWDLDNCDENGLISSGDNPPCPFCNTESFIDYYTEISDKDLEDMEADISLSEKDIKEILESNMTKDAATRLAQMLKQKYQK